MPLIPSPPQQRRRLISRAALLVVAPLFGALLLPAPADAVLLWKRKKKGAPAASAQPAPAPAAAPARDAMEGLVVTGGGLAESVASSLSAPEQLPSPASVANYPHELRTLTGPWQALSSTSAGARALALVEYGNALARINRDGPAARAYAEALAIDESLQPAWNNLGSLARRSGALGQAESIFRSVLAEDPEAGLAWFNLAMTLEAGSDWDGADEAYLQALTFSPELWLPSTNPLIIGNKRAKQALHRRYLVQSGRGSIYLAGTR